MLSFINRSLTCFGKIEKLELIGRSNRYFCQKQRNDSVGGLMKLVLWKYTLCTIYHMRAAVVVYS